MNSMSMTIAQYQTGSFERALQIVGGAAELARRCGVSPQAVDKWKRGIPPIRVRQIVCATNGVVTAHDLRPDLYPKGFEFPADADTQGAAA